MDVCPALSHVIVIQSGEWCFAADKQTCQITRVRAGVDATKIKVLYFN